MKTDVLIVGAGPTGLMAANQLNRFGIDFIIIDGKNGPTDQSRAIVVTSRSLEIYEQMGLADEVIEQGQQINSFHFFNEGKERGVVELGAIGKGLSDFNYVLAFEQSKNEELLYRHLHENGKDVQWETTFVELISNKDDIQATAKKNNEPVTIHAKYLIACDGASSPVRHALNMTFKGGTYQNKFFVADTLLRWPMGYDGLVISPGDNNFVGFFPMKGKSNYRVLGTMPDAYQNNTEITFPDIEKVVIDTLGVDVKFEQVNWFSIYNLHHRSVDNFKSGNVFLAGDAAHIHSPAGGQGMNTGLQDAYNLGWKMAFVLKGWANPSLLDTYNEERLPFAKWLMSFTDMGFNILTSDNRLLSFARKYLARVVVGFFVQLKPVRPLTFKRISQIWYSYRNMSLSKSSTAQKLKFKAGDRLPYVIDEDKGKSIYHKFSNPSFYLVHIGNSTLDEHSIEKLIRNLAFPIQIVESNMLAWKNYNVKEETFILARPDNYILWIGDSINYEILKTCLAPHFNVKKTDPLIKNERKYLVSFILA